MTATLKRSLRLRYERDGIVFPIRVLTPDEVGAYRAACDDLETRLGGKPRTVEVRQMHLHFAWAYRLATHPPILDAACAILGPDLLIWATELFAKHPHDGAVSVGWHRDRSYMGVEAEHATTAWVALADSVPSNGCMRAVPGPGRKQTPSLEALRGSAPDDVPGLVDVILRAGEMSLHDADIPHGSTPNCSAQKRVGFVIRYVTPAARPGHDRPPVILARGRYDGDHFRIQDPPVEAAPEEAAPELTLARMKESAAAHLDAVLGNLRGGRN
jgi:hypothetical protein